MSLLIQEDPGLARKRKLAEAMMQRGQRTGPVSHWTEGLSRVIDQGAGAYFANKAASQEEARKKASMASLAQAMAGNGMQPDGMGPPQPFMSRLENVEGINPEMIASLKLQQAMAGDPLEQYRGKKIIDSEFAPTARDPIADHRAKAKIDAEFKGEDPKKKAAEFKNEKDLRGEFQKITSEFRKQQDAFGRVVASAKDPSAAGDLALIFNYMKTLDPGSTVREGEFATAAASGSYGDRIQAAAQKIIKGERLSNDQRADFVSRASKLYEEGVKGFEQRSTQYQGLSEQYEADPSRVVSSKPLYKPEDYADLLKAGELESPPTPMNEEAYNALPPGAIYIDPDDGKQYRKPE